MAARNWKVEKYARFVSRGHPTAQDADSVMKDDAQWKFYEGLSTQEITLSIIEDSHLVLTVGDTIHENHSLWNARSWMKGISKGDSMLFVYKVKNESRRFRVKFAASSHSSGTEQCSWCVALLQHHFHVKKMNLDGSTDDTSMQEAGGSSEPTKVLDGTVTISKLTQVMSGQLKAALPVAYTHTNIPQEDLGNFIRLCLSDSNFPAFVGEVEKELTSFMRETPS
ncbi:meiotic recombination protein REC114 [Lamellibrachia satsuma]|nr:meiotic recombination protein REC114 [Lamellibrachia satsuma]